MGLINGKSKLEKAASGVDFSQLVKTAARSTVQSALNGDAGKSVPALLGTGGAYETGKAVKRSRGLGKPTLILASGVAGITAASAAVSAVRRGHAEG